MQNDFFLGATSLTCRRITQRQLSVFVHYFYPELTVQQRPLPRSFPPPYLQRAARSVRFVHADERVLERVEAAGGRHVARVVATVHIQQRVVALLDVPHQLQHLLRGLRPRPRLVEFPEQAGSVIDEGADVLLVDSSKLFDAMSAPIDRISIPQVVTHVAPQPTAGERGEGGRRQGGDGFSSFGLSSENETAGWLHRFSSDARRGRTHSPETRALAHQTSRSMVADLLQILRTNKYTLFLTPFQR